MQNFQKAAAVGDLNDGQMKEFEVNGSKVLLVRTAGQYHAYAPCCTHYGAPLEEGVLSEDRIVCPWHHACFCKSSGGIINPPALDALPEFEVRIQGQDVMVLLPEHPPEKRVLPMKRHAAQRDSRTFVIVGAGAAGAVAAETLRQEGFEGRLVMISREYMLPYDRTLLSKAYMAKREDKGYIPLRGAQFYEKSDIEVMLGKRVVRLNLLSGNIEFDDGGRLAYDAVLVASGGIPMRPDIPGANLKDVFTLRVPDDADHIIAAAIARRRAVVVGASFIGMECAASLRSRDVEVTVVAPESVPFESTLGLEIGRMFKHLHEQNGVRFFLGSKLKAIQGKAKVEQVTLDSGEQLDADLVVMGTGIKPATQFIAGVEKNDDGSLSVDAELRIKGLDNAFAAGDIATFPDPITGRGVRIEHWRVAQQHGRLAALNMLGLHRPYREVPFFWSGQFNKQLRYIGHAKAWDDIYIDGDLKKQDFLACYVKDGRMLAAAGMKHDTDIAAIEECFRLNRLPSADELARERIDWQAQAKVAIHRTFS